MPNLDSKILTEFSEVLNVASYTLDLNRLGDAILDVMSSCFHAEKGFFELTLDGAENHLMLYKNIDEKWVVDYKKYFFKYSPFRCLYGKTNKRRVIELEEVVDLNKFYSSEYYFEFYKPQNIFYKIFIKLMLNNKIIGQICLCRSLDSRNFSSQEISLMGSLSNYISYALMQNNLLRKTKFNDSLLKIIEDQWEKGILILDDNMKPLFINEKYKKFFSEIIEHHAIPPKLLEDLYSIKKDINKKGSDYPVLPRHRNINYNSKKFSVRTQIINNNISLDGTRNFMISIKEIDRYNDIDQKILKTRFYLSEREIDIVMHVYRGLRNSEIAQELFISEVTVKKHMQNIFEKISVKNRTSLINRVLNSNSYPIH